MFVRTELIPADVDRAPLSTVGTADVVVAAAVGADAPGGRFVDRAGAVAW